MENQIKAKPNYDFIDTTSVKFIKQQERLQSIMEGSSKYVESHNYNTRYKREEEQKLPINSYQGLLSGYVITCKINNEKKKNTIIELIETAGGCYMSEETEFCTVAIVEKDWSEPPETRIPQVHLEWLYQTINEREVQEYERFFK